jgi:hypothetical protein
LKLQNPSIRSRIAALRVQFTARHEFDEVAISTGDDIRTSTGVPPSGNPSKIFRKNAGGVFLSITGLPCLHARRFKSVWRPNWLAYWPGLGNIMNRIGGRCFPIPAAGVETQSGKHGVLRFLNALVKQDRIPHPALRWIMRWQS